MSKGRFDADKALREAKFVDQLGQLSSIWLYLIALEVETRSGDSAIRHYVALSFGGGWLCAAWGQQNGIILLPWM